MSVKLEDLNGSLIEHANKEVLKDYLHYIVRALDDLDDDDYFGTQGWRYFLE